MAHPLPVKYYFVSRLNTVILDVLVVFTNLFYAFQNVGAAARFALFGYACTFDGGWRLDLGTLTMSLLKEDENA